VQHFDQARVPFARDIVIDGVDGLQLDLSVAAVCWGQSGDALSCWYSTWFWFGMR
jgi:hypothetical protein